METTSILQLKITTESSFASDDIKETITEYGNNFKKLESLTSEVTGDIENIDNGRFFQRGFKIWNSLPIIGDYVGWVNTREGVFAKSWKPLTNYSQGQLVTSISNNGKIYECVSAGRSSKDEPNFLTGNGVEFNDASGEQWVSEKNYNVDDIVFPTNGSKLFYYICETAGMSDSIEPDWDLISTGTTNLDGSVVWRKEKTIRWKQVGTSANFRPFGKID